MAFNVNSTQCKTCIFGANTPITPESFEQYKQDWQDEDCHHICHQDSARDYENASITCRGYYEAAMRGDVHMGQLMRIAGRLNMVRFVDIPKP